MWFRGTALRASSDTELTRFRGTARISTSLGGNALDCFFDEGCVLGVQDRLQHHHPISELAPSQRAALLVVLRADDIVFDDGGEHPTDPLELCPGRVPRVLQERGFYLRGGNARDRANLGVRE